LAAYKRHVAKVAEADSNEKETRPTITRKAVERYAEQIGADITRCQELEIQRAVQLPLPHLTGLNSNHLYRGH
jgi:hypothetical protein